MNEASFCAERLDGRTAELFQGFGNLVGYVISKVELLVYDIHDGRRPAGHGFKEGIAVSIRDGIVGADIALYKFFHNVGDLRVIGKEAIEIVFVFELICTGSANAVVGLDDDGITADIVDKFLCGFIGRDLVATGGGNACFCIILFHSGFALESFDGSGADTCGDVEIGAELRILFEPIFIVGFDPIDLAVLKGEESNGAENLVVIFERVYLVVFCERCLELGFERIVFCVADTENVDTVFVKSITEIPICVRKIRRNKDEIHKNVPL